MGGVMNVNELECSDCGSRKWHITAHRYEWDLLCEQGHLRPALDDYQEIDLGRQKDGMGIEPIQTEEGATYTPWTDGYAVGYKVSAEGKPDRWILLNPSQSDSLAESNAFVYLESAEPTKDRPQEQPVCYVNIWDDEAVWRPAKPRELTESAATELVARVEVDVFNDGGERLSAQQWGERGWEAIRELVAPVIELRDRATGETATVDLEESE